MVRTLWDSITEFLSPEAGQRRTQALQEFGRDVEYYVPPELRGLLGFAAEMTTSETLSRAGQAGGEMLAPGRTPMERVGSAGRMLSETAGVAAPIAVAQRAGMTAAQALQEALLGASVAGQGAADAARRFALDEAGSVGRGAPLPTPRNDAEAMARDILEMRAAGRAGDVTDEMMAAADPQYMFANTPLPMDEASRMARAAEMGFVPGLHGTGSDFIAVDESFFGTGPDLLGSGFYTTTNPNRASRYAPRNPGGEFVEGANVMPMMVRERNPFLLEERQGDVSQQIAEGFAEDPFFSADSTSSGVNYVTDADGRRIMLDPMQPRHYAVQNIRREFGPQEVTNALSDLDYSGISGPEGLGNRVRVSFNPQDVRSRFARFDPRLSHLANLNAANIDPLTGAVAMGASQQQNTDPLANLRAYIAQYGGVLGR